MESSQVKYCTLNSSEFQGRISINKTQSDMEELERKYQYLNSGGHHIPEDCKATSRVAIIVPYRDREAHLKIFLNNMHPFLIKQKLDYSIIVVEQIDGTVNRAKLLNIGFVEALKLYDWQCFIFHDVDILPEDDRNLHNCPFQNPRHMAVAVNKFGYKLAYERIFGASSALTAEQFRKVNGFSNRYWGWGGEDDDMYTR
uniref:Beta-1,4-N-acetylgalactosaminyltransferase bre-4 n=1 Tax=Angiostrongylus cantonensis TaxID=6313 RepID=A0A0K0DC55_ANGCA